MNCTHVWQRFLGGNVNAEVGAAVALLGAAVAALLVVNFGGAEGYAQMLATPLTLGAGEVSLSKTLLHWVNDGLMALFFVVIGIEIRREMTTGSLQTPRRAVVPMVAAVCGFAVPAVIYLSVVWGEAGLGRGWSIPAATDIAFAVALLTVLRRWVPASLRAFLLVVAVTDDLLVIGVIAVFYTTELLWLNLLLAGVVVLMLLVIVVGTALDFTPTVLILTPVLMPLVRQAGIDPVYFGVLFIMNNAIGLITPPVGTVLNVVCGVARINMDRAFKGVLPFLLAQVVVLFLLVAFPPLVLVPMKWFMS